MKLLMIFPSTRRGGAEVYSLIVAVAASSKWQVDAAFPQTEDTYSLIKDFTENGITYHPFKITETEILDIDRTLDKHQALIFVIINLMVNRIKFYLSIVTHFFRTIFLLIKIKPDVVMINLPWADYCFGSVLACGVLNISTVVNFHCIPYPLSFSRIKLKLYHWAYRRNQKWITITQNYQDMIAHSFQIPPEQILLIYNGIKVEQDKTNSSIEEVANLRLELRQELGLPENTRIVLTVARLGDEKGHDLLIPAMPHLTHEFSDLKFVWVGDGEKRATLVGLVQDYNMTEHVLLLGYRSDIPRILQGADLFVLPTYFEGLPFALLEAMVYGLPVIVTNTHGVPEVIEHQVHGLLTRKGDSCDLLEAIRWALRNDDRMQEMAKKAKLRVKDFSQEKMLAQTLELLSDMAKERLKNKFVNFG